MKVFWKIGLSLIVLLTVFYFLDSRVKENEPLESPVNHGTAIPVIDKELEGQVVGPERPKTGLSTLVGQSTAILLQEFGEPDRIEPSTYAYDWWIYNTTVNMMVGIEKEKVNQVFSADVSANLSPYEVGQNVQDIFRFSIIESEVNVQIENNLYTFSLSNQDIMDRMLIKYEDLFAQVYVDAEQQKIVGIRFIDPTTLIIHQPYDMEYMGELVASQPPSSTIQIEVDRANERQIVELTNYFRDQSGVPVVEYDYWLTVLAQEHSKDMAIEKYFSHESPSSGNLSERLKSAEIEHKKAGENIATNYVDAIEAVHGWLNSPAHRSVLLDPDVTDIGTGAYGKYYTQVLIKTEKKEKSDSNFVRN